MPAIDVGPEFGSLAVGFMLNLFLFGASFLQCFIYFSRYRRDPMRHKIFVGLLLIVDTIQSGFVAAGLYEYLVVHFGDLEYLSMANIPVQAHAPLAGITACCVQVFFAIRVKQLTGYKWAYWLIITLAIVSCGGAIASGVAACHWRLFVEFSNFKVAVIIWLVGAAIADVTAAAILVWYLKRQRTGFAVTDGIIDRVVRSTVQTGLATSFFAILDVIVFLVLPSNDLHLLFNLTLPKLYTNSVMSVLNSRRSTLSGDGSRSGASEQAASNKGHATHSRAIQPSTNVVVFKQTTAFDDSAFGKKDSNSYGERDGIAMSPIPHSNNVELLPAKRDSVFLP